MHTVLILHDMSYSEYCLWLGRWVYRRTVDLKHVCLQ